MSRLRWFGVTLLCFGLQSTNAAAGSFVTGNQLYDSCREPDGDLDSAFCLGYVSASADFLVQSWVDKYRICFTSEVSNTQLKDVVIQWMAAHPEKRHFGAAGLVGQALIDSFRYK